MLGSNIHGHTVLKHKDVTKRPSVALNYHNWQFELTTRSRGFNWRVKFICNFDNIHTVFSTTQEMVVLVYKRISA
jgi:hypothetical protein